MPLVAAIGIGAAWLLHEMLPAAPRRLPRLHRPSLDARVPDGRHPCLIVQPGVGWNRASPIDASIADCLPGLRTDRSYDELEVNLAEGSLAILHTDLLVTDAFPIVFTRCYRLGDTPSRSFGIGWNHPYDILQFGTRFPYTEMSLLMPDGDAIRYTRISEGTSFDDAVFEHTSTATPFLASEIWWNGDGWDVKFPSGGLIQFPENYRGTKPHHGAPIAMRDGQGHTLRFTRDSDRNLEQLTSSEGHSLRLRHDMDSRVTRASDDLGHIVEYKYDAAGRLTSVTDDQGVRRYRYRQTYLVFVEDSKGPLIQIAYDGGLVSRVDLANGRSYGFAFSLTGRDDHPIREAVVDWPDRRRQRVPIPSE